LRKPPIILKKTNKQDFHKTRYFPGTHGNPFDVVLRYFNDLNRIPALLFLLLIAALSGLITLFRIELWISFFVFILLDDLILHALPKLRVSFGPVNSQVFLLFVLRAFFIWIPAPFHLILQTIGTFLVIYGFVVEPGSLEITPVQISSNKIAAPASINFVQIGDIHLEKLGRREEKLLKALKQLAPQFILFTGDFLNLSNNQDRHAIQQVAELMNKINEIAPTYCVSGSPAVDLDDTISEIRKSMKAAYLKNENVQVGFDNTTLNIIGLHCSHIPHNDYANLANLSYSADFFNLLMYHSPDLIYELEAERNIDLMIAGHTHGGQVRLPFLGAIFSGSLYGRKLQYGLYQLNQTLLFISRGIGLEGMGAPRVRFLCRPEIVSWTIHHNQEEK
jgi:predicted MPP superfamily phosphohydrolase